MKSLVQFISESRNGEAELYEILQNVTCNGLSSPRFNLNKSLSITGSYETVLNAGLTPKQVSAIEDGKLCAIVANKTKGDKISLEIISKNVTVKLDKGKIDIRDTESIDPKNFNNDWYLVGTDLLQKEIDKADLKKEIKL